MERLVILISDIKYRGYTLYKKHLLHLQLINLINSSMTPLQKTHVTVGIVILLSLAVYLYTTSLYALILPALMGLGLIRAGITGNCPMENWFAKFEKKDKSLV